MELAVCMFSTDRAIAPDELAVEVEQRGFGSLWFPEHTHIPVDHSPWPGGDELPEMYFRTYDPFVALTAAATATTDLRIGTGVLLVAQHDPITVAKQVASLDRLSGGRLDFGIGYGWDAPEVEHHGVAFADRRAVVREYVLAMKQLWTEEVASYEGAHVRFGPSYAWPKPTQRPHPPILLGAALGPKSIDAMVEFCDGWMPIRVSRLEDKLPRLRRALEDAGRDPDGFEIFVYGTRVDADKLRYLADLGVDRVGAWLPSGTRAEVIPVLDRYAALLETFAA